MIESQNDPLRGEESGEAGVNLASRPGSLKDVDAETAIEANSSRGLGSGEAGACQSSRPGSLGEADVEIEIEVEPSGGRGITEAVAALPPKGRARVRLLPGFYRENVIITRSDTIIEGAGQDETIISGNFGAREPFGDGRTRGTFRTQTVFIHAAGVTLRHLTIENTAGPGRRAGQAIALYADGDRLLFDHVNLRGWQDTLFTGPLPPTEIEPGGFRGPLEYAPRVNGRQRYVDCRIEGTIDFIFGSATAVFDRCTLVSMDEYPGGGPDQVRGYVLAPSTPEGQRLGYVFRKCVFCGDCPPATCYLGRPWRDYARACLLDCRMGPHIRPEGWHDWNKPAAHTCSHFAEHGSLYAAGEKDPPAGLRRRLTAKEVSHLLADLRETYESWPESGIEQNRVGCLRHPTRL